MSQTKAQLIDAVDGSIVTADLADDAVTTAKLNDLSVTTAKIAGQQVTTAKIADNAITSDKINAGAVGTTDIAEDAVTGAKIAGQTITGANILDGSVSAAELASDAVTTAKLADGAVNNARIADDTITNAKINSSAAIAGTKVNPSFGNQALLTTNSITVDGSVGDTIIASSGAEISFTRAASNNITCSDSSGSLNINTGGSNTRLHVKADGRVGIGTTSPSAGLHISTTNQGLDVETSNAVVSEFKGSGGAGGYLAFQMGDNGANIGYLGDSGQLVATGGTNAFLALRGDNGIELAVSTARKVRVDSDGIKFGTDTAAANALNDYETGTWTPFVGTQGGSDYTLGTTNNCYTKIGNLVYAYFSYQFTAEGSGSISIFNLPFAADNSIDLVGQGYVTSAATRRSLQFRKYTSTLLLAAVDDGTQYLNYWTARGNWAPTNTFVCHIVYKT